MIPVQLIIESAQSARAASKPFPFEQGEYRRPTPNTLEINTRRMAAPGVPMEEQEAESADLERLCQGASPNDEPCDYPATVRCARQSPDKDLHVGARRGEVPPECSG